MTLSSTPSFDADGDNTADTYVRGDKITVDVRFSQAVTVTGGNNNVRLRLDLGADDTNLANSRRVLMLKSVVGGNTLRFERTVAASDSDADGVWVQTGTATNTQTVFTVRGATVTSTATGAAAVLTKSGLPTTGAANHKVNGSRTQAPANRAPTFSKPERPVTLYVVDENNAAGAAVATMPATDPDGDTLTYSLDSASDALFDIDSSGAITVTAANTFDHETQSEYTITVSVHDGKDAAGGADTTVDAQRDVRVVVADSEEPPVFAANAPTTLEVAENNAAGAAVGTVAATDSDGDALTYALDSASDAVFDIDSSGAITVTAANALDHETTASYAVTVSVHDGKDAAGEADTTVDATHSLTITVTDVEEPPFFAANAPTTLEVAENNAAGAAVGTVAATDPDGDALTYALDSASDAVFDIDSSGAITVTAANALDYETTASYAVTVSVHDGKNAAGVADTTVDATHSLTITVTDVEESTSGPPTIASVTLSSTPSFDADGDNTADTYVRGDKIAVDVRFSAAVTVTGGNNNVRLRLDLGADDTNLANSRRVLMLKSVVGGNTLRFERTVAASDSDADGVWVQTGTATNTQTVFTVRGATVTSTATGAAAVLTKSGLPTTGAANHKVNGSRTQAPANRAPTFSKPERPVTLYVVDENNAAGAAVATMPATDPDGDTLTYSLDSASDALFDIDSSGAITVTAANTFDHETQSEYTITVSVHDGKDAAGGADTTVDAQRDVRVVVADSEEPPVFAANAPTTLEVAENNAAGAAVGTVAATDSDGDALTYALDSASDAVFDIDSSGAITVTAANALDHETTASYAVTVSVHDGKDAAGEADTTVDATHSLTITVTDVEEPPFFAANAPTTLEVAENNAAGAAVGTVAATDPDGDALTYALDSASDAVFDIDSSGAITVTAANALDYETTASYAVTVSVHDGKNAAGVADTTVDATHSLTITVTDVEESTSGPPTIASVTLSSTPSFDADGDNTADTYVRGDKIAVDVRFSAAVTVTGGNNNVRLRLDLGADDTNLANSRRVLMLKSVVGGNTLRFERTVAASDSDADGVWVQTGTATNTQTVFTVRGATVTSTATGAAAVLTKSGLPTTGAANHKVNGSRTQATNRAPTFAANAPTTLEVAENNAAGAAVGTVAATDPDGDALTYALDSASDAVFDIDSSGAITVTAANALDHETQASYAVTVSVHDGKNAAGVADTTVDATHSLTIAVTDVPTELASAEPVKAYLILGGSLTSTRFQWRLPSQPAGVTVSAVKVQVLPGRAPPWKTVATLAPAADSEWMAHEVIGLTPGEVYIFRIRLVTNSGNADSENIVLVKIGLPKPVTDLSVSNVTRTTVDLSWEMPPIRPESASVGELNVQQRGANGDWTTVATIAKDDVVPPSLTDDDPTNDDPYDRAHRFRTAHTVTGLTAGTSYTFRIRLVANGYAYSETVSTSTLGRSLNPAAGLTVSNTTATTLDLTWALVSQPAGVTVTGLEVQQQSGGSWTTVASLDADATSYTVTGLTEGTSYTFRVRLAANNGTVDSETVAATALASPKRATDLAVSNQTRTGIGLSWSLPTQGAGVAVSAVEVQYKLGAHWSKGWSTVATLASDATSHTVTQVTPGSRYAFRIRLVTNNGHADSQSVKATALEPPKPATGLSFSNANGKTVVLSWTLPAQPEGVVVKRVEVYNDGTSPGEVGPPDFGSYGVGRLAADETSIAWGTMPAGFTQYFLVRLVTNSGDVDSQVVSWPKGLQLWVGNVEVREGEDDNAVFTVSLNRAPGGTVTVDYATADRTALAGEDYTAVSGTLTFGTGETAKTVSVPILDDAIDEGEETFVFRLSNATGAAIADGEARGTIVNSDPLQRMWLSRFGRTVADHVTGAVSDRLAGPLTGAQLTVGGQSVNLAGTDDEAWLDEAMTSVARALGAPAGPEPVGDGWPGSRSGGWESQALANAPARTLSGRELLLGSAFHLAQDGDGGGPGLAAWGRVTASGFDGQDGNVRIDGDVTTGTLGADAEWNRVLAGVAVSVSDGDGTFDQPGVDSGTIESTMTTVSPYARVKMSERVSAWGLVGFGTGDMTIVQAANDRGQSERITRTDLAMRLGAVGGRGALLQADETGGMDLALKADAFYVETTSEAVSNEGDTTADATRVRLAVEGSRAFRMDSGSVLTPGLELGLRHDGGDAETGTGVELGGRVAWTDVGSGLSMEASVRTLIAHEDSDYREWGASGALRLAPGASGRGLSFSLAPTWGTASSGVDRLWSARDARGLSPDSEFEPESRLAGELGYGIPAFGGAFTGTPNVGFGLSDSGRDYRFGWRLTPATPGGDGVEVSLDATRTESAGAEAPEHGVMLRGALRW